MLLEPHPSGAEIGHSALAADADTDDDADDDDDDDTDDDADAAATNSFHLECLLLK